MKTNRFSEHNTPGISLEQIEIDGLLQVEFSNYSIFVEIKCPRCLNSVCSIVFIKLTGRQLSITLTNLIDTAWTTTSLSIW